MSTERARAFGGGAALRRLAVVLAFVLAAMAAGAGWAASQTAVYQSAAVLTGGDTDLKALVGSSPVAAEFRERIAVEYGPSFAATTVGLASGSADRVEIATESIYAGVTTDLTQIYVEAVVAVEPSVVIDQVASFPTSPRSPNLPRTALLSGLGGLLLGCAAVATLEQWRRSRPKPDPARISRSQAAAVQSPSARPFAPIEIAPLEPLFPASTPPDPQAKQLPPDHIQPGQVPPDHIQPDHIQPGQVQPDHIQPGHIQPGQVQPGQVQPGQDPPNHIPPDHIQPNHIQIAPLELAKPEGPKATPIEDREPAPQPRVRPQDSKPPSPGRPKTNERPKTGRPPLQDSKNTGDLPRVVKLPKKPE